MAKKKKMELKITGTKLQKTCLVLQVIVILLMIVSSIYVNVNNIESGFITEITNYGMYVVLGLLIFPYLFQGEK